MRWNELRRVKANESKTVKREQNREGYDREREKEMEGGRARGTARVREDTKRIITKRKKERTHKGA